LKLGEHLTAEILGLGEIERSERVKALKKMSRGELDREDNIVRNRKLLDSLEIGPRHASIFEDIGASEAEKAHVARKGKTNNVGADPAPARRLRRQQRSDAEDENPISMENGNVASELSGPFTSAAATHTSGATSPVSNRTAHTTTVPANNETRIIAGRYTFRTFIASLFPEYPDGQSDAEAVEIAWATSDEDLEGVEREWAAANRISARRVNTNILTYVNKSDWPDWLSKNFEYLTMNNVGSLWSLAVVLWTELERHYGFASPVSLSGHIWACQ
jgi:hypothetical protein